MVASWPCEVRFTPSLHRRRVVTAASNYHPPPTALGTESLFAFHGSWFSDGLPTENKTTVFATKPIRNQTDRKLEIQNRNNSTLLSVLFLDTLISAVSVSGWLPSHVLLYLVHHLQCMYCCLVYHNYMQL